MSRRRSVRPMLAVLLLLGVPGVARAQDAPALSDSARAFHALNRLAFGPRPGDLGKVLEMGLYGWIGSQLRGDTALDASATAALAGCPLFTEPATVAEARLSVIERFPYTSADGMSRMISIIGAGFGGLASSDSLKKAGPLAGLYQTNAQLITCRLARVESTENQLLEVMTDFWQNHFSVFGIKIPSRASVIEFDRITIRPRALGRFRDLLGAVAHSPSMLEYLDNAVSTAAADRKTLRPFVPYLQVTTTRSVERPRGLNENYARELLELHTLGVDGGYTQNDVIEVARAFTGWTHPRAGSPELVRASVLLNSEVIRFFFDSSAHDAEAKVVLGTALAPDRGLADGEDVLDLLARHPSTARNIARKLCVRFISDNPPESIVERAAATFRRSDGDIREVMRTIVTSDEFFSPSAFRAKVKSPHEFVLSMRRALGAAPDVNAEEIDLLLKLEQAPYARQSPDGWSETGSAWMNVGAMSSRLEIAMRVGRGELKSIELQRWPEWDRLLDLAPADQVRGVISHLLGGSVSANTRSVLEAAARSGAPRTTPEAKHAGLGELVTLALASPEFQRR